jgi:hypothetical protein
MADLDPWDYFDTLYKFHFDDDARLSDYFKLGRPCDEIPGQDK